MLAYIALVWNDADPANRDTSQKLLRRISMTGSRWRTVLRGEGLAVCCLFTAGPTADEI